MYIGLSGGIGSGKSTVAKMLADLGATVIDADVIARKVVDSGTAGFEAIKSKFGSEVVLGTGELDRQALAKLVFSDRDKLQVLESIVHPAVVAEVARIRAQVSPNSVVVYDTPLLAEKDMAKDFDHVIMVTAPLTERIDRLLARGLGLEDVENRIANQMNDPDRIALSDFHISNDGSLTDLRTQVEQVWSQLTS